VFAVVENLQELYQYRALLFSLIVRELKVRYRGSVLGFLWSFLNPLLLLSIYTFVFTVVVPNRKPIAQPYAVFMFCGILPWNWFSSSLLEASRSLVSGGNLIKKVLFPAEILPIVNVLANMVHFFLGLTILVVFLVGYQHWPDPVGLLWFPVVVLVQLVFTIGLALFLSALTVHYRDIRDLLSNLLMFWFFATPIIYPWQDPNVRQYKWLFDLNPFTHLAVSYQEILFFPGPVGHAKWLVALGIASIAIFLGGYWFFDRLRDSFAEAV
jgi:ABC-type polysaccharide/polyol phosphate export permease